MRSISLGDGGWWRSDVRSARRFVDVWSGSSGRSGREFVVSSRGWWRGVGASLSRDTRRLSQVERLVVASVSWSGWSANKGRGFWRAGSVDVCHIGTKDSVR